jgi:hypothetical protein
MAEVSKKCVECGRPLAMFSGLMIGSDAYHTRCWEQTRLARSAVSSFDQTRLGSPRRGPVRRKLLVKLSVTSRPSRSLAPEAATRPRNRDRKAN